MKEVWFPKEKEVVIREMPRPVLQPGMAIIRIELCGICGSDITAYQGTNPTLTYPIEGIGHEGVGVIEEIGGNDKGLKAGDRVTLEPYVPCNKCHMCEVKRFNNCENLKVSGVHRYGMMTEYFLHPISLIYKIPDSLDFRRAALVEPLTIGLHALTRSGIKQGEFCVIFGAGTIGLLASFGCLSYGATPILIDVVKKRLDRAKELGIKHTYFSAGAAEGKIEEYLCEVCGGALPDVMLDCTGSPAVIGAMHNMVRHGGRISLVGWPHDPVTVNTIRCMRKELDIHGSRNSVGKFPEAIEKIMSGVVPVNEIVSKIIKAGEVEATIQDMIKNPADYLKVLVTMRE